MKKVIKYIFILAFAGVISLVSLLYLVNLWVEKSTSDRLYSSVENIPYNKVGLVLGTSKYRANGNINLYFKYRMRAVIELFNAKKIDYIIVSGDNAKNNYNEPAQMQKYLIKKGIPKDKIQLDYAGFRTLDSVLRAKKVFGQQKYTVISQPFHNKRAIFIAKHHGYDVIGFNAKKLVGKFARKVEIREYFARVKAVLDLYILKTKARFYGEKIEMPIIK